jgi:trimethylamine--corrinoid protein Co-methyltransferase
VLASLVLAQLAAKGARFCYCSMSTIMDLRHMIGATGAPEHPLIGSIIVKLAAYYGLPSWIGGGVSDSKLPDAQSGYEYGIGTLLGALAGANIIYGAGALESCLLIDYAKLVMDCEALSYIRRILDGVRVDDHTLAVDAIAAVGPKNNFLGEVHTLDFMREQVAVNVFDRGNRSKWELDGARTTADTAYARARELLAEHRPEPLPAGAAEAIAKLIADREKALGL